MPLDPALPLLVIYQKKYKAAYNRDTFKFTAALFTIAKLWNQLLTCE
jgi:hypothetical protein